MKHVEVLVKISELALLILGDLDPDRHTSPGEPHPTGCPKSPFTYSWLSLDPAGTGVPPHVHPTQDEFIYVFEGVYTLYLDGQWTTAGPGDLVQMPKGIPHAYYNKQDDAAKSLFWVSPGGKLANLFSLLHNVTDPAEVVRLSALNGVDFLPEGAVEGA
ncbi:cupin domain-containing protein [Pseudoclavibacter helvolus]|uniref:cupin domain-containing protein n=1 Tax=Pseudoclavibacter helvolus TaxID=255205 RepID=UPI003D159CA2